MMNPRKHSIILFFAAFLIVGVSILAVADEKAPEPRPPGQEAKAAVAEAGLVAEARLRSRLLHETIHGSLQVMHRDFFREGKRLPLPSKSLEDVFNELDKGWQVKIKWIAVNAEVMNVRHTAETEFDKQAVKAISEGGDMFDAAEGGIYHYAGSILLGNQCLKCHVPQRTSLENRKAALVISMPLKLKESTAK